MQTSLRFRSTLSRVFPVRTLFVLPLVLLPSLAQAHPGIPGHMHGFASGFGHPLSGLDHLLAMTAVGLWAVQRGGRALWLAPLAFLAAMTLGGVLGMAGLGQVPFIEQAIAASVLTFGILIASAARLPLKAGVGLIGLFALFHGYAHGAEMPAMTSGWLYGLGFVLATASLHLCGISLGLASQKIRPLALVRYAGAMIAVLGVYLAITA